MINASQTYLQNNFLLGSVVINIYNVIQLIVNNLKIIEDNSLEKILQNVAKMKLKIIFQSMWYNFLRMFKDFDRHRKGIYASR